MKTYDQKRKETLKMVHKMVQKIGCGRKVKVGFNKILNCDIKIQCGMTKRDGAIVLCDYCYNIKQGRGNRISDKLENGKN